MSLYETVLKQIVEAPVEVREDFIRARARVIVDRIVGFMHHNVLHNCVRFSSNERKRFHSVSEWIDYYVVEMMKIYNSDEMHYQEMNDAVTYLFSDWTFPPEILNLIEEWLKIGRD